MKKVEYIIINFIMSIAIGCSHKAVDGVSYIRNSYETTFESLRTPMTLPSNIILIRNNINNKTMGIYLWNSQRTNSHVGKWELVSDTLILYPELDVSIRNEKFTYGLIDTVSICERSISEQIRSFQVRNDTLYEVTDYTEFFKKTAELFGIGADYKYDPNIPMSRYKLLQYKRTK